MNREAFQPIHIDGDQIRLLSHFDTPDYVLQSESFRSIERRHLESGHCIDCPRVFRSDGPDQSRCAHLPHHIEVVVAGRSVRSKTDVHASVQHFLDGSDAASQFEIAVRTVHYGGVVLGQKLDVLVQNVHAVRAAGVVENAQRSHVLDGRASIAAFVAGRTGVVSGDAAFELFFGFLDVDVH